MRLLSLSFLLLLIYFGPSAPARAAETPSVAATIKPIHSLVAAVMQGVATPHLLISGNDSPHGVQLTPSQRQRLSKSEVIFFIDRRFERFLDKPMQEAGTQRYVALATLPAIALLPVREGGLWHTHRHEPHEPSDHAAKTRTARETYDFHIWLHPHYASAMLMQITQVLAATYPEHRSRFERNAATLMAEIAALDLSLKRMLAPLQSRRFLVFHDATRYFEQHYGLHAAGSVTFEPHQPVSAKRISQLRKRLKRDDVHCLLAEPQASKKLIETIRQKADLSVVVLDPEGTQYPPSPDLYLNLMHDTAESIARCLSYQQTRSTTTLTTTPPKESD